VAVESSRSDGAVTEAVVRGSGVRFRVVVEPMTLTTPCGTACADTITTYRLVTLDRVTPVLYATSALT
jgi:hypothetical protein